MKIMWRLVLTVLLFLVAGAVEWALNPFATLMTGKIAGAQLAPSDEAYVSSFYGLYFFSRLGVPLAIMAIALLMIWWRPLRQTFATADAAIDRQTAPPKRSRQRGSMGLALALIVFAALAPSPGRAYYDKQDWAETYFIMPNESAFYIPDVGDNKTSQVQFGSMAYYEVNKVAAKRFIIPHVKLENSGAWSNFYVPAGRLIIVDRSPYSREWVDAHDRGTSKTKQGFPCQSNEGLDVTVGLSIGVTVREENAAKFLYRFGVNPPEGDRTKPEVVFTSVLHSRSLERVTDTVVRNKVQALACNEISKRPLDQVSSQALQIMEAVRVGTETYLAEVGITLEYLGWADTMNFAKPVQDSIDERYATEKLRPVMDVLVVKAALDTMKKWDGRLPTNIGGLWLFPSDLLNAVVGWFRGNPAPAPTRTQ